VEPYQLAVWISPLISRVYTMGGEPVALSDPVLNDRGARAQV